MNKQNTQNTESAEWNAETVNVIWTNKCAKCAACINCAMRSNVYEMLKNKKFFYEEFACKTELVFYIANLIHTANTQNRNKNTYAEEQDTVFKMLPSLVMAKQDAELIDGGAELPHYIKRANERYAELCAYYELDSWSKVLQALKP